MDETGGFLKRHLDKIGVGGALFAALGCLGIPALLVVLSAVGLGFLINDAILIPLLLVFLLVALGGLYLGTRRHHEPWALILGAASAVVTFVFSTIVQSTLLAVVGIVGLVAASLLNIWLRIRQLRAAS